MVDALRFTQDTCKRVFECGRSLAQAAIELANDKSRPIDLPKIRVVKHQGLLLSLDNRCLWALKESQRQMRERDPSSTLFVHVALFIWDTAFDTSLNHLDH